MFPNAMIHLQDREMAFATGRFMREQMLRHSFAVDYVTDLVRALYDDRMTFVDGVGEIAPGITLHHIGGHTDGLQVVRVWTKRGWVVLASDASHFYANMERGNPFPVVFNVGEMLAGHRTLGVLADSPQHIIPGHDPLVMTRYPVVSKEADGIAIRVDVDPLNWD
jgi:glyoxylase-like metal-dependent hydrolase (beta-lactamase superfamily II)